ncbi:MAG: Gfo/Idh/MocA family oxidoreductase [Caldilineaceae bacterium]|nr:Gfo/Idh/MocA family oxidoreductase [Caldilineaceae bacterium]
MSTKDKVRVGVIGVGQIGKAHLDQYSKMDNVELVAVADINDAERDRVLGAYGIPTGYANFRDLLARDDIQAVDVCLHNNFHRPVTVAALEAGKDVFCEKPMAGAYTDAEAMMQAAHDTGRKLSIQNRNYFLKETRAARALIDDGHLGRLYHARSTGHRRRGRPYVDGYGSPTFVQKTFSGGGALYDMGVYHISTILYLLGNPQPRRISGHTYQEMDMDPRRRELSGYSVEELGVGFVRMENNVTLDIIEAWAIHMDRFEGSFVVGSKGGVRLDPFGFFQTLSDLDLNATGELDRFIYRRHNVHEEGDIYDGPQQHWIAALQGRVDLIPTAEIALNCMLISEGIFLSTQLEREVSIEEVREMSKSTAVIV